MLKHPQLYLISSHLGAPLSDSSRLNLICSPINFLSVYFFNLLLNVKYLFLSLIYPIENIMFLTMLLLCFVISYIFINFSLKFHWNAHINFVVHLHFIKILFLKFLNSYSSRIQITMFLI